MKFLFFEVPKKIKWIRLTDQWKMIKCPRCEKNFTTQKIVNTRVLHRKCGKSFILHQDNIIKNLEERSFGLGDMLVINEPGRVD